MKLVDDFSISKLFVNKDARVFNDGQWLFTISFVTVKDIFGGTTESDQWNRFYSIITDDESVNNFKDFNLNIETNFDFISAILFKIGYFYELKIVKDCILYGINKIFGDKNTVDIDNNNKQIKINNTIMTNEIWNYVIYLLKLSYGENVKKPITFNSEEEKQVWLKQQKLEEKIKKIRQKAKVNNNDINTIIKAILTITYAFPSITIDYLYNQTMAQIQWLQKYAAGSLSYEVSAKAFAAGNMKKGSKLDFFIK